MKRGSGWPIAVVLILATTVAANIWVMHIAASDPSFAIEPDYYRKAVNWDSTMAQERINQALAWRVMPKLGEFREGHGATLRVRITAPDGVPIDDAMVRVLAFAVARSGTIVDLALPAHGDGAYSAQLPLRHGGAWELRFDVRRGPQRLTAIKRVEAVPGGTTGLPEPSGS